MRAKGGFTALHLAAKSGDDKLVRRLASMPGLVNSLTDKGWSPLHLAALNGSPNAAEVTTSTPCLPPTPSPPQNAAIANFVSFRFVLQILIENGAKVDGITQDERSPTHIAAAYGRTHTMRQLIQKGNANIHAQTTKEGYAPIHFASLYGHDRMVELILQFGADVNLVSHSGWTPIHLAAKYGHKEAMQVTRSSFLPMYFSFLPPLFLILMN